LGLFTKGLVATPKDSRKFEDNMTRIVVHNHLPTTRSIGRFRATAGVRDHSDCGCGCGGKGDCNHSHDAPTHSQRDQSGYTKAELGIDVTYTKGGYGRPKISESRHYSVPDVTVDPRGHPPSGAFVADQLRRQPGYHSMIKDGWTAGKVEGYYKREQRDVGRMV
jgi:hypothetical protein